MTDSDEITRLVLALEPLAAQVSLHLCIIGAGEEFFRATHQKVNELSLGLKIG